MNPAAKGCLTPIVIIAVVCLLLEWISQWI